MATPGHAALTEHEDVGIGTLAQADRVPAVGGRGHHLEIWLQPEQELERLAEVLVVLDQRDADRIVHAADSIPPTRG